MDVAPAETDRAPSGLYRLDTKLKSVVLPAPFGPIKA